MTYEVTVVIPMYNRENYIGKTIESVLGQQFTNFKLLILDDSSTDSSVKVAKNHAKNDRRVEIVCVNKHMGHAKLRNYGNALVETPYIAIMDSDDIMFPHRLSAQYNYMQEHPDVDILGGGYLAFGDAIELCRPLALTNEEIQLCLLFRSSIVHGTAIMRKSIIEKNKVEYRENYLGSEDWAFWVDLIGKAKMANLNSILIKYRIGRQSQTVQVFNHLQVRQERKQVHRKIQSQAMKNLGLTLVPDDLDFFLKYYSLDYNGNFDADATERANRLIVALTEQIKSEKAASFFEMYAQRRKKYLKRL